jgi:hypothetical protein
MPFIEISLARGKSREYHRAVSPGVHRAFVQELGILPGDQFQLIHQYEPEEMISPGSADTKADFPPFASIEETAEKPSDVELDNA